MGKLILFWKDDQCRSGRPGARFSKVPKIFRARKAFVKLQPTYSVKLVLSYVVQGIKIKITAKFCASRRFRFEDTKRINASEKFRDFREKGPSSDQWYAP